jgi:hypothetical protein
MNKENLRVAGRSEDGNSVSTACNWGRVEVDLRGGCVEKRRAGTSRWYQG